MNFLFSTGSLYTYSIARCFELAAAAGFDGIELMVDDRWDARQPAHLHKLIDRFDLPVLAVHSPFSRPPGWPADEPGKIHFSVRLAENLGAPVVVHHLPVRVGYAFLVSQGRRFILPLPGIDVEGGYQSWLADGYERLQASTSVRLCIENMPARRVWGRRWNAYHWNTLPELGRFSHLTMDTTHLATWGHDPLEAYARWNSRIGHVHLSNFDGREHRLPEAGVLALDQLLARMAGDGYRGAISLELHPDSAGAGLDDDAIVARLARALAHCRSWAADSLPVGVEREG